MNSYYNYVSGVPAAQTRGTSPGLRAEFALIQAGFEVFTSGTPTAPTPASNIATAQIVNASWVNAWYAPIASPTLTGTPRAPTAAFATSGTQIATLDYVLAQAMSAAVPGQMSQAGKEITTDGTAASWGLTAPGAISILNFLSY